MKRVTSNAANYQCAFSSQTLREGLAEYQRLNPNLNDVRSATPDGAEFFRCHDAVHVVFACDTSFLNEAMTDAWTLFGTTVTARRFIGFMKIEEHEEIIGRLGWFAVVLTLIRSLPLISRIIYRSLKMKKTWPWDDYTAYLDVSLRDIRHEHGIRPLVIR
jgi:hypothetical protein